MKKYLQQSLLVLFLLGTAANFAHGGRGPTHKSLRAYAMGNAFTAVAEDKDAVYYNPANLWLINRFGNYEKTPELGYYTHNFIDMRLTAGGLAPASEAYEVWSLAMDFERVYRRGTADPNGGSNMLIDTLAANSHLSDRLNAFDRRPVPLGAKFDAEMAFHGPWDIGMGGAIWADGAVTPYIDGGIITPSAGVDSFYTDIVMQGGLGFRVHPQWLVGVGYKAAQRTLIRDVEISMLQFEETQADVEAKVDSAARNITDIYRIGHALEFGGTYLYSRELRFAASLRNFFINKLGDEEITPDLTMGVAFSPRKLQRNTAFSRKVNFAADFENMLNDDRNYKFFSHLNFGMEMEQTLLALPGYNNAYRFLKGRAGAGFKGGYWTFGAALEVLRFVEFEFATWAEELGYYTGEKPNRFWVGQVSLGI